ncbi:MAG: hypothetical protein EP343_09345 [Deltaproteobacteria bacterium]|nr:MAG: hypothetical protein EP343_09345 [Deltaproteobacteria bacterium]
MTPKQPGTKRKGLSLCWMDQVKRATPSLFQCAVFDATTNAAAQDGYFHPDNYGSNYRRSVCNITGTWTNPDSTNLYRSDFQISCNADDGQSRPDPSKRTVGWAVLTVKPYAKPGDSLAGCIDEVAH